MFSFKGSEDNPLFNSTDIAFYKDLQSNFISYIQFLYLFIQPILLKFPNILLVNLHTKLQHYILRSRQNWVRPFKRKNLIILCMPTYSLTKENYQNYQNYDRIIEKSPLNEQLLTFLGKSLRKAKKLIFAQSSSKMVKCLKYLINFNIFCRTFRVR